MQGQMQCDQNHECQSGPFMQGNKKMPERNPETAVSSKSFWQYKPIQESSTTQNSNEDERYDIDYPKR
jgi:hypothetical protein